MAGFNPTGLSGDFHYLVEFVLDSTTLKYADEGLSIHEGSATGSFYDGRLSSDVSLRRSLGTFLEPRETVDTFDVILDNGDGELTTRIDNNTFANRGVRVWLGEGSNKKDYSQVFTGYVAHPNGYSHNEQDARFTVIDQRERDRRILPLVESKFHPALYPNIEKKNRSAPIPIVYGNWSSAAASGVSIPCACTDVNTFSFKVASHGLSGIDRVLRNAVVLDLRSGATNCVKNISLAAASFDISGYPYNATSDIISVNCKGLYTANGTVIETPGDVLQSILKSYVGLTGSDLNGTSFNTLNADTDPFVCRRVINTETSSEVLTGELINENSVDLRLSSGKYSPKFRKLDSTVSSVMRDTDIVLADEQNERADFNIQYDPERFYANQIRIRYQYDPIDQKYLNASTANSTTAIARDLNTTERQMDFNWLWQQTDAEARMNRELYLFADQPEVAEVTLTRRALLKDLADSIDLTYSIFDNRTLQIRSMETNLADMTTRVLAYDVFTDTFGTWMADSAPAYSAASVAQRQASGFWTDDNGLADPTDPQSDYSHWF